MIILYKINYIKKYIYNADSNIDSAEIMLNFLDKVSDNLIIVNEADKKSNFLYTILETQFRMTLKKIILIEKSLTLTTVTKGFKSIRMTIYQLNFYT